MRQSARVRVARPTNLAACGGGMYPSSSRMRLFLYGRASHAARKSYQTNNYWVIVVAQQSRLALLCPPLLLGSARRFTAALLLAGELPSEKLRSESLDPEALDVRLQV